MMRVKICTETHCSSSVLLINDKIKFFNSFLGQSFRIFNYLIDVDEFFRGQ